MQGHNTSDFIIETAGLTKEFRGFTAVNGVDLKIRRNTIHALIGPNGAGKTTCFNLITKFLEPTRGTIWYNGRNITALKPADVARLGLVRSFQISATFPHLTLIENVRLALQRRAGLHFQFWRSESVLTSLDDRAMELLGIVGLTEFASLTAVELSYGRKRALEIATTIALEPEVLLLDEPMAGMGQEDIVRVSDLIRTVARDRTVLMVEHNLNVVASLSDTITVLARGEILSEGTYGEVSRDARVVAAYMGSGAAVADPLTANVEAASVPATAPAAVASPAVAPLLAVRDLHAYYGESHILHGMAFDVAPQRVTTLLGRNGAGKSTTLRAIMGMVKKRRGSIVFDGTELVGLRSDRIARAGVAFCPEDRGIFASLTVTENLLLPPVIKPGGLGLDEIYELFPRLKERASSQGTKLSGGEQQMLAIARILRSGSKFLLLDEPTEGLAPVIVQQIGRIISSLKDRGFTVLLVEQNFHFAATVADHHYIVEHGVVIDSMDNSQVTNNKSKLEAYLGV